MRKFNDSLIYLCQNVLLGYAKNIHEVQSFNQSS